MPLPSSVVTSSVKEGIGIVVELSAVVCRSSVLGDAESGRQPAMIRWRMNFARDRGAQSRSARSKAASVLGPKRKLTRISFFTEATAVLLLMLRDA